MLLNQSTNEVELRKLIDKLREERLDDRADVLYWWLTAVAIFLTLFAIAVPVLGYLGATRLITIEKDAKAVLKNIQSIQGEAKQALAEIDAQRADKAPEETKASY